MCASRVPVTVRGHGSAAGLHVCVCASGRGVWACVFAVCACACACASSGGLRPRTRLHAGDLAWRAGGCVRVTAPARGQAQLF